MATRNVSVAIVGSGFSGIGLAIRLKAAGFADVAVFERAGGVGGVWRDNTYPGAACDAPSHLYSYSFEPNPRWSRRFAPQPEILGYLRACVARHDLDVRLNSEVVEAAYDGGRWTLRTADGGEHTADILVAACGQLSRPARPDLDGLGDFRGAVFHSAEWDHSCDLAGRVVAVVGNGASAVQIVPEIAGTAARVTVYQRTPHWVGQKWDRRYPRARLWLNARFPIAHRLSRLAVFLWFELGLNPMLISPYARRLLSAHVRAMCHLNLRKVADPGVRRALTPDYELGCKRVLVSSDYYRALDRPDVELVAGPIEKVTPYGIVTADGRERPADVVVLATGFRSHDFVAPMKITGAGGRDLNDAWRGGARAYLGLSVSGFPNFFLMYGPNTNVGSGSVVYMLESQIAHIAAAARMLRDTGAASLEVREDAMEARDRRTQRALDGTVWNKGGCTSWYTAPGGRNASNWPGSMFGYRLRTRRPSPARYRLR